MKSILIVFPCLLRLIGAAKCPSGFEELPREDGCVIPMEDVGSYDQVASACAAINSIPVKIMNYFDNSYVQTMAQRSPNQTHPYIGTVRNEKGIWTYADGGRLDYSNWAEKEPNSDPASNCTIIDASTGKWNATTCSASRSTICSIDQRKANETCPDKWVYFEPLRTCYYLQNFTYPDGIHWQVYGHEEAETNCRKMNSHLASIHSDGENNFLYDLVYANMANMSAAAPLNEACSYQWARIGMYGTGVLGNGNWTDGTPVDYVGGSPWDGSSYYWLICNDPSCRWRRWAANTGLDSLPRYVCKLQLSNEK